MTSRPSSTGAAPRGRHFGDVPAAEGPGLTGGDGAGSVPPADGPRTEKDPLADAPLPGGDADADPADDLDPAVAEFLASAPRVGNHHHHHHRRHRHRLRRRLRAVGIALLVVALVAGGVAMAAWRLVESGRQALREAAQPEDIQTVEEATTEDEGLTVEYEGKTYRYNENVVSIVVMGYDRRQSVEATGAAGQADAIMVVAFDTATGQMRVIGVPRDTMVDVDENVGEAFLGQDSMQISLAFSYGDGYETSSQNVVRAVSRVLYNMPMTYYFSIDMEGVGPLNDAIGGVALTPTSSVPGTIITKGQPITLYGENALRYVQYRDTSVFGSSLDRQARQSQYLQAFFSQAVSNAAGSPGILVGLYQTALKYATTNLGVDEFAALATTLLANGMSSLEVTTLQGEATQGPQYLEYHLDRQSVYETVLDVFYTPVEDSPAE